MQPKQLIIDVKGVSFKIKMVSNWVMMEYHKIDKKQKLVEKNKEKMFAIMAEAEKGLVDVKDARNKIDALEVEIRECVTDLSEFIEERYALIEEILNKNGYEFDRDFWLKDCEPSDVVNFLSACYLKDTVGTAKKLHQEASMK